jgi:hypothetical protein
MGCDSEAELVAAGHARYGVHGTPTTFHETDAAVNANLVQPGENHPNTLNKRPKGS